MEGLALVVGDMRPGEEERQEDLAWLVQSLLVTTRMWR